MERRRAGTEWAEGELSKLPPLLQAVLWRRSFRVYEAGGLESDDWKAVTSALESCPTVYGAASGRARLVTVPEERDRLLRSVTSGFIGRTNAWLRRANPAALLVLLGDEERSPRPKGRWLYNVDVALLGEAAVLAAAERRIGSCWMAAIDEKRTRKALGLRGTQRIPAVIPMGRPRVQAALNLAGMWDRLARRLVSSRRKPFEEIHFLEQFGNPEKLPRPSIHDLPEMSRRTVPEIMESLNPAAEVSGPRPEADQLAWLVELCRQAPTADNSQIWRLVLVRNDERARAVLRAAAGRRSDLAALVGQEPGCVVVAAAAPFFIKHRTAEQPFALLDVPIGLLHMVLGAQAMGLAWNLLFDFEYEDVRRVVGLPENHEVVALLLLGAHSAQRRGPIQLARTEQEHRLEDTKKWEGNSKFSQNLGDRDPE